MKRFTTLMMVVVFGALALEASAALAGSKGHNGISSQSNNSSHCKPCKDKGNCGTQRPPGQIVDPVILPPPTVVRDHRHPIVPPLSPGNGQGGVTVTTTSNPIVRDHRGVTTVFPPLNLGANPIVRDHRGVTATTSDPIVRDHRGLTSVFNPVSPVANPIVRDHRGVTTTSSDPVVRDHRGIPTLGTGLGGMVNTIGGDVAGAAGAVEKAAESAVDAVGDFFGF